MKTNGVFEHIGISNDVGISLCKNNFIKPATLFVKSLPLFDPCKNQLPFNQLSLLYYVDKKGDFTEGRDVFDQVAMEIFKTLDKREKQTVMSYLKWNG